MEWVIVTSTELYAIFPPLAIKQPHDRDRPVLIRLGALFSFFTSKRSATAAHNLELLSSSTGKTYHFNAGCSKPIPYKIKGALSSRSLRLSPTSAAMFSILWDELSYGCVFLVLAMRIQISAETKTLLDKTDCFLCEMRGPVNLKGKGKCKLHDSSINRRHDTQNILGSSPNHAEPHCKLFT